MKIRGVGKKVIQTDTKNKNVKVPCKDTSLQGKYLPVAQLDNAVDSDSKEWGFKSLRADQSRGSTPNSGEGLF